MWVPRANSPSAPTSPFTTSSATYSRTRRFPAFTSRSAILTARTPGRTGTRRPTSTSWAAISTSGSTAARSCAAEHSCLIPSHRRHFNREYSEAKHDRFLAVLEERCGEPVPFRHSETPCFLPGSLIDTMVRYGREMVERLLADPRYRRGGRAARAPAHTLAGGE